MKEVPENIATIIRCLIYKFSSNYFQTLGSNANIHQSDIDCILELIYKNMNLNNVIKVNLILLIFF